MRVAFILDRGTAGASNRTSNAAAQLQIVVGRVDDGVDCLLDQVACDDHDLRFRHAQTSAMRSSRSFVVTLEMPRTPMDSMVNEAQATPHTSAS